MYLMYFPNPIKPKPTWMSPESIKTASIIGKAFPTSPSLEAIREAITTILSAVIGAVGPEIWVLVPPKRAAKKLKKIAPYRPAVGPKPEDTPKAKARGRAIIPAVIPPKTSPFKCENNLFINKILLLKKWE